MHGAHACSCMLGASLTVPLMHPRAALQCTLHGDLVLIGSKQNYDEARGKIVVLHNKRSFHSWSRLLIEAWSGRNAKVCMSHDLENCIPRDSVKSVVANEFHGPLSRGLSARVLIESLRTIAPVGCHDPCILPRPSFPKRRHHYYLLQLGDSASMTIIYFS